MSPDTAIEDGHATLTLAGQQDAPTTGRYMVVHVKRNGKWQIISARDLPADSAPTSDPLEDLDWMIGAWNVEHLGVEMNIDCRWLADKSFVEATYSKQDGDSVTPMATQIIGVDPRTGRITSWMFNADRGYAHGVWMPRRDRLGYSVRRCECRRNAHDRRERALPGRGRVGLEIDESNDRRQVRP